MRSLPKSLIGAAFVLQCWKRSFLLPSHYDALSIIGTELPKQQFISASVKVIFKLLKDSEEGSYKAGVGIIFYCLHSIGLLQGFLEVARTLGLFSSECFVETLPRDERTGRAADL